MIKTTLKQNILRFIFITFFLHPKLNINKLMSIFNLKHSINPLKLMTYITPRTDDGPLETCGDNPNKKQKNGDKNDE